jgi:hypothetical protein
MNPHVSKMSPYPSLRAFVPALIFTASLALALPLEAAENNPGVFNFQDDFSSATNQAQSLDSIRPAGATVPWQASANLVLCEIDGKGAISSTRYSTFVGRVSLPSGVEGRLTLEATLCAVARPEKQDWVALGFGNPGASEKSAVRWPQGVFVAIRPNGGYTLFLSPDGEIERLIPIKKGKLAEAVSRPVPVHLVYDPHLQTLSLTLDGKVVMRDYELANRNFTPTLRAVGFSGFGQEPGTATVSAFKVQVDSGR